MSATHYTGNGPSDPGAAVFRREPPPPEPAAWIGAPAALDPHARSPASYHDRPDGGAEPGRSAGLTPVSRERPIG